VFASDPGYRRRILLALAASLFVHALIVAAGPLRPIRTHEEDRPSTPVVLETRMPTPRPTPAPTPKPTPKIVLATPKPVTKRVAAAAPAATAKPARRPGGSARPKELAKIVPTDAPPNGTATAAGSGVAAGGSGTGAGPGTGSGGAGGPGTGAGGAAQPCGHVSFVPTRAPSYVNGKWYETIRTIVEFPDGHTETAIFPYPWVYADQNDDPWSPQNLRRDMPAHAQLPPAGATLGDADGLIRLVLQYTRPNGTTVLPLCPGQSDKR
jgi:hypothetical protein